MANRINASNLSDLLLPMRQRGNAPGVYFVRLCQWSPEIKDFLWRYHEAARAKGVIIEGQIGNPDERQLSYLTEMLGSAFEPNPAFITQALQKWMPRMSQANRVSFAEAMCAQMDELKRKGKTDSIIRNIYMKVMCWLYYKFERLMPFLGVKLYTALGADYRAFMLFNSITFVLRLTALTIFIIRYKKHKAERVLAA